MTRFGRLALGAYGAAALVAASDQALKYWMLYVFDLPQRLAERSLMLATGYPNLPVLGPFHLSLVMNQGVSFGFLDGEADWTRWALSGFDLAVAIALALWAWRVRRPLLALAIGLVMGGAIGNLIDRLRLGAVVDFLDFRRLWFPWVFNIADSAITIGVILLIADALLAPPKRAPV
ncbi:MAG TPA: signal peptidase II [Caulobacteraceae bacterium]|nr:signal peptidase II [Caulobacteraceae bacterium]